MNEVTPMLQFQVNGKPFEVAAWWTPEALAKWEQWKAANPDYKPPMLVPMPEQIVRMEWVTAPWWKRLWWNLRP